MGQTATDATGQSADQRQEVPTGAALVVTAAVLWSLQALIFRQIHVAGTWTVMFWRSVGMLPVLLAFVAWRNDGQVLQPLRRVGLAGTAGGIGLVLAFAGAIYALQTTAVAMAVFLFSISPFLAAILGWLLLHEPVRRATWGAMALAGIGLVIMLREGLAVGALAGNLAALASGLGFAGFSVALRAGKLADMMPAVVLGGLFSLLAGAVVVGLSPRETLAVPLSDILWSTGMGAGTLAAGMVLYTLGSRALPAAEMTLLSLMEVLLAPIWVWLVLGETARAGTLAGGALILVAVALNALSGGERQAMV
ncbi:MAG: DMT family transporter [Gemmobacter sp.]|jgi:drug/metabolite transporter (DMT)-like permease|nr:DMT family transporter [Gemmobacter sp.]